MIESRGENVATVTIGGETVPPGESRQVEIPVAHLPPTRVSLSIPVDAIHGSKPGPRLWLSGAIHGDELNGVEIVRRVIETIEPGELRGLLLAVPIVNVFGLVNHSRYLPDRRDLNRCFPGSLRGTLGSRLAHIFMNEIVAPCTHGIDFHTGSNHRTNLAQIRADVHDPETRRCALAFGAPLIVHSQTRDGSLRQAATEQGRHVLLFEGGEPLRFDAEIIDMAVKGTLRVLRALRMIPGPRKERSRSSPIATKTSWVRARRSGLCRLRVKLGDRVDKKERLGVISDLFGSITTQVVSPAAGVVIGLARNPLVNQGDGLVHVAVEFEE